MNNRTLLMHGVAGETRPIFSESDAFLLQRHTLEWGRRGSVTTVRLLNNRTLLMYGVAGEKRPMFSESDAFLYILGDHN